MAGAYRTVSADAICVLVGVEPFDLRVEMSLKCGQDVREGINRNESAERRKGEMMEEWQTRWETSDKGRTTFGYIGQVRQGGNPRWKLNHYVTQCLSGHGNFKSKLAGFGLVREGLCSECRVEETAEHVVLFCERYEGERREMREKVVADGDEWCKEVLMREENREGFFDMITAILKRKEELEEVKDGER